MGKNQYSEFFERYLDAILVISDDKIVDCNAATVRMLGYSSKQELLNKHPLDLSPAIQPDGSLSNEKADRLLKTAFEKGKLKFEWEYKKADGTIYPAEVILNVIPNGGKKTFYTIWRDLSEQNRFEKVLNAVIDTIADPIYIKDEMHRYIVVNKALSNFMGLSKKEIMNKSIHDLFSHAQAEKIKQKDSIVFESGFEHIKKGIIKDAKGHKRIVSTKKSIFTNDENKKILVGTMRDITEQVEIHAENKKLLHQLQKSQKMEAIGNLARLIPRRQVHISMKL